VAGRLGNDFIVRRRKGKRVPIGQLTTRPRSAGSGTPPPALRQNAMARFCRRYPVRLRETRLLLVALSFSDRVCFQVGKCRGGRRTASTFRLSADALRFRKSGGGKAEGPGMRAGSGWGCCAVGGGGGPKSQTGNFHENLPLTGILNANLSLLQGYMPPIPPFQPQCHASHQSAESTVPPSTLLPDHLQRELDFARRGCCGGQQTSNARRSAG
jgi:hypothetical protein